jgi:hypothetical protein
MPIKKQDKVLVFSHKTYPVFLNFTGSTMIYTGFQFRILRKPSVKTEGFRNPVQIVVEPFYFEI